MAIARGIKLLLWLALPIYALDQATKAWIIHRADGWVGWQEPVIPGFFDLCYLANTGAAFSMLRGQNVFFSVLSLLALTVVIGCTWRGLFKDVFSQIGVGLLVGGILGNLTDRLLHGHVVDFLLFDLHVRFANPWPAFNVADSGICVAAGLFILSTFIDGQKRKTMPSV